MHLNRYIVVNLKYFYLKTLYLLLACLLLPLQFVSAAMDPRFEIDPRSLSISDHSKSSDNSSKIKSNRTHVSSKKKISQSAGKTIHTVKPGENLFKILMRDYALSNEEAEIVIEEIRRENNIYDIRRLKVGQKIIIPSIQRATDGNSLDIAGKHLAGLKSTKSGHSFLLESPVVPLSQQETTAKFRLAWNYIISPDKEDAKPISFQSSTFSLILDPLRFPSYLAVDGGRIIVDQHSVIPPLVKALITEKDPLVRIVSESPTDSKRFLAEMISAAKFYSTEENFNLEYGVDPKLAVRSDFKIEKTPDSLINQDVILMNSGHVPLPSVIGSLLKKGGFTVLEPFASLHPVVPATVKQMHQVTSTSQVGIIDSILTSLSVKPEKERRLDVFAADNNGISLSVNAERYFELNGRRNIIARFDGDPVAYTLFRILETLGYRIIILDSHDDFKSITTKLSNRLELQSSYAQHTFEDDLNTNYSVYLSGFKIEGPGLTPGGLFVTNLALDRVVHDVLTGMGYSITSQ